MKSVIKEDTCTTFHDETKPLHLEPDTARVGQFENKTQQDKDWTYTKARHEPPTDDMEASTQYNNGLETANDCAVSPLTTNIKGTNTTVCHCRLKFKFISGGVEKADCGFK